jgi:toxin ParE1/3/4
VCAHKPRLSIKPEAQEDIDEILLYTRTHWGIEQRREYRAQLQRSMRRLQDHPKIGFARDDLYDCCRCFQTGRHFLYYRVTETEIVIGRVLQTSQEPEGWVLPEQEG